MKKEEGRGPDILRTLGRYKFVLLIAAIGVALMLWPGETKRETADETIIQTSDSNNDLHELETGMEEILKKIQGVGRVDVMLTLQSSSELILASDTTLRYSGNPQNPGNYDRSGKTVTVSGGSGSEVVVTQEKSPQYRGALIVCDGGDSDSVRLRIVEAVSALTGLGADRIAVVRWGSEEAYAESIQNNGEDLS